MWCGFCGKPSFSNQELLEQHIDSCAPIHGFIARFGTDPRSVGRRFACDPVSGLATLRPQNPNACPWCLATSGSHEESRDHRLSCTARRDYQALYEASQAPNFSAPQPARREGDVRPLLPRTSDSNPDPRLAELQSHAYHPALQTENQNLTLQPHSIPTQAAQLQHPIRTPYFDAQEDEGTLLMRINVPPSHAVTSLLVDIARKVTAARAIPRALVHPRQLPFAKYVYGPAPPRALQPKPKLQPKPQLKSKRPIAPNQSKPLNAQPDRASRPPGAVPKPNRIRFTMCEGCDTHCKHFSESSARRHGGESLPSVSATIKGGVIYDT